MQDHFYFSECLERADSFLVPFTVHTINAIGVRALVLARAEHFVVFNDADQKITVTFHLVGGKFVRHCTSSACNV